MLEVEWSLKGSYGLLRAVAVPWGLVGAHGVPRRGRFPGSLSDSHAFQAPTFFTFSHQPPLTLSSLLVSPISPNSLPIYLYRTCVSHLYDASTCVLPLTVVHAW